MVQATYSELIELLAEKDRQIARLEARVAELEGLVARLETQNLRLTQLLEQAQRTNPGAPGQAAPFAKDPPQANPQGPGQLPLGQAPLGLQMSYCVDSLGLGQLEIVMGLFLFADQHHKGIEVLAFAGPCAYLLPVPRSGDPFGQQASMNLEYAGCAILASVHNGAPRRGAHPNRSKTSFGMK